MFIPKSALFSLLVSLFFSLPLIPFLLILSDLPVTLKHFFSLLNTAGTLPNADHGRFFIPRLFFFPSLFQSHKQGDLCSRGVRISRWSLGNCTQVKGAHEKIEFVPSEWKGKRRFADRPSPSDISSACVFTCAQIRCDIKGFKSIKCWRDVLEKYNPLSKGAFVGVGGRELQMKSVTSCFH